ncbi:MAG: fumarylacetoacetate hydrolase family protein [Spirochaetaceae bacterium]|nr:fumarylacetoacetate hydrolase family protein [Spirochaetaceae bacterium]
MKLSRTGAGTVVERDGERLLLRGHDWDELFRQDDLTAYLDGRLGAAEAAPDETPLAPVVSQEIWAAGVTYYRSRDARMAESEEAGGGSFYDRVYTADRPELFCKGSARTVVAPGGTVRIRADSAWNVPEPELTLAIDRGGRIFGYTIGNDMSSRDIEGENPLYLPQAKTYDGSCALGGEILVRDTVPAPETAIEMEIIRDGAAVFGGTTAFRGSTTLAELKRTPQELASFLYRHNSFPDGCFLMTGTGIIPPDGFTLHAGDRVTITIESIGTLSNTVGGFGAAGS